MARYVYIVTSVPVDVWVRNGAYGSIDGDNPLSEAYKSIASKTLIGARFIQSNRALEREVPLDDIILKFEAKPPYKYRGTVQ